VRAPAFLRRRPRLRWRAGPETPLVPDDLRREAPDLEPDLATLDRELLPRYHALDRRALRAQNAFRLGQLVLILGGVAATTLGAVQAALGGGHLAVGVVQAAVAFALGVAVVYLQQGHVQSDYLTARIQAERLRSEYFQFLGRVAPYDDAGDDARVVRLRRRVREIELEDAAG
jgi:Protein of unknown function (DUF4231)